ncbi:hypothetical protein [Nitrospira moscoviensis]|uniref:DUF5666 domain-containing protein n=1 Tax=Nitrospira moscoviensis TaxID=42253 RepID=A0A0K2GJD1_NITMO|nr:hypothetical protein [Nitrospira moscoviensis]ALA60959.1 conserved exported protein of unknown function [Nitrospira moscoviensis]
MISRLSKAPRILPALLFATMVISSAGPGFAEEAPAVYPDASVPAPESTAPFDDVNPSVILKGSVWRMKPGIVFLRTPIGLLTLSSKTTLKDVRASHEVTFWIHGAQLAVDIRKRADGSLLHRYLSGPFKPADGEDKTLRRWTPEGEKSFHYGAQERALAALREDDLLTVEVDDTDTVVGLHDLQFDLQVSQLPASGSDTHLLLTGTVSKLKSNFIFFRTPIGVVNVNAKIGIKNAKVGQTMTLHIHRHHVVADLASQNAAAPVRRFVTGPLQFATPEHTSVKLWTPDGEQTYPADRGRSALSGAKEGSPITVELNGQGSVVEFHRFH